MNDFKKYDPLRHNPSRKECEDAIRRILMTEVMENGRNKHFKNATDFMTYFESLYPAGDSLTKQVQRAVKAMAMPRDEKGYFIINKTKQQVEEEQEISYLLQKSQATTEIWKDFETLFLHMEPTRKSYLLQLIDTSETLKDKYLTILDTTDGLLFYTKNAFQLQILLDSLINSQTI
jgi:hypothetical protein